MLHRLVNGLAEFVLVATSLQQLHLAHVRCGETGIQLNGAIQIAQCRGLVSCDGREKQLAGGLFVGG